MTVQLTLPYPVSANRYWRSAVVKRRVAVYVSDEGKAYRSAVTHAVLQSRDKVTKLLPRVPGPVVVAMRLYTRPGGGAMLDVDNAIKVTLDALVHANVIDDDKHVECVSIRRVREPRGCIEVLIGPYPED